MGCLYQLIFPSGKSYIGITTETMDQRIKRHVNSAKNGASLLLSRAIRKYGEIFERKILVIANDWEYLCELEKRAIIAFNTFNPNGYNLTNGGEGGFGLIHTEESKLKMSKSGKGKIISEEAKEKMAAAKLGIKLSENHKLKIGAALKGKKNSLGVKPSQETKDKQSKIIRELKWFNNGENNVRTKSCPDGFVAGRLEIGRNRYNNGVISIFAKECPEGFVAGMLPSKHHWFNDGSVSVYKEQRPDGFNAGRLTWLK